MKVILQERVMNLGNVGDQVTVKSGYARNFLLPRGKAVQATEGNVIAFEKRRAELEKKAAEVLSAAKERATQLEGHVVTLTAQASEEGKLFGSIGPRDIAKAVHDSGKALEKSEVEMPEGPIRMVGEFTIGIHLHGEVSAKIKLIVNPV
ncbi:MAG: 50S ribosomal protein L9 [Gammaproteobacteria bacterium CG_4_10_14_0_8_um_filter_38_16]|nr:MAG: 50S ribosomal protein L9 [Gammaproteobacteria bacterium CG_4_10_14_0_8_um_filter_38_16]PJA04028.1 MAG: 50S ribosomal protein L9 [Gammaproteobacteria bacterium CG_4_10_14_0_2_um_filter_38_22]PJB10487.1 MAG: 50S ribosomal protein L9 [Gammaproteobacteria bacterium CG_4_9_14_3_um_filter_38_9]